MKKQLLFSFAAFAALAVTAQNSSRFAANPKAKKMVTFKPYPSAEQNNNQYYAPVPNINLNSHKTTSAVKRIGGSRNSIGVQNTDGRALTYNAAINTIGMVLRTEANWYGIVTGGNSGTIGYVYSTNGGTSWDSTILVANATKYMRHPGGTIYNPAGNTNPALAYAVGSAPWHPGSAWQGNAFASKQLTFPGDNITGPALFVDNLALAVGQVKQDFARTDMQATTDGKVHVLGSLIKNINDVSTNAAYGWRGGSLNTGTFNAGSFTWTVDSLKPNFKLDGIGDEIGGTQINQAWSDDGQTGYVIFNGVDANALANTAMNSYQPYVYKTTNSGTSWSRFAPLFDFTTIPAVSDRLYASNTGVVKPFISTGEGSSATVDASGNLHYLATMTSSYSDNIDSLGYTISPNYNNVWNYIVDFNTNSGASVGHEWCAFVIDSLHTSGPTATETNWLGGASGALAYDARLQISRTTNGQKIIYSWVDTDTTISAGHINTMPNIHMKGYDLATNKMTATKDMSNGKPGADLSSFWFLSSPIIANPVAGTWQIPTIFTASDDGANIPDNPVSYYYMDDNTFTAADFNTLIVGGCTPTGVKQLANTTFENLNFYPNPASTSATIEVQLNDAAKLDITVLNSVGQTVYATSTSGNIGSNKVNINLSNLTSGLYFYQVKIGNSKAITKKFAVEK